MTTSTYLLVNNMSRWHANSDPWPNPSDSISTFACNIPGSRHIRSSMKCWTVQGPALEAYDMIRVRILQHLDERGLDLYEDADESSVPYSVECYMIGKAEKDARPYLVIICSEKGFASKVEEVITTGRLWDNFTRRFPGFGGIRHLPQALAQLGGNEDCMVYALDDGKPFVHGSRIFFAKPPQDGGIAEQAATFGHVVHLRDIPFGLTVAHPVNPRDLSSTVPSSLILVPPGTSSRLVGEILCCSNGTPSDYLDWALMALDPLDVEEQSQVSYRGLLQPGQAQVMTMTTDLINSKSTEPKTRMDRNEADDEAATDSESEELTDLAGIGTVLFISDGNGGFAEATLNGCPSLVCLPGTRKCRELWGVTLTKNIQFGDCGKWVSDRKGDWYGHVIAGIPDTRIAYIARADEIIGDIKKRTGILLTVSPGPLTSQCVSAMRELRSLQTTHNKDFHALALCAAVSIGCDEVVRMLTSHETKVVSQGKSLETSKGTAATIDCEHGTTTVSSIWQFDNQTADHDRVSQHCAVLQAALQHSQESTVQALLDRVIDIDHRRDYYSAILRAAALHGHKNVVQMLLDRHDGVDIESRDSRHGTALHMASFMDRTEIVQMLLDAGADVSAEVVVQGGLFTTPLQAASERGNNGVVELLLSKGADTNVTGGFFGTALQAASTNGHKGVVQALLRYEADVNIRGGHYNTALQAASAGGFEEIVGILLDKGADVDARGGYHDSAMAAALQRGHVGVHRMLLASSKLLDFLANVGSGSQHG